MAPKKGTKRKRDAIRKATSSKRSKFHQGKIIEIPF